MKKHLHSPPWLASAFLAAFLCLGATGCGKVAITIAVWLGSQVLSTVVGETLRSALSNVIFPTEQSAQANPGENNKQPVDNTLYKADEFNPLRGRFIGELTLKSKTTGKQHTFSNFPVYRETVTSPWRISPEYRDGIAAFLE